MPYIILKQSALAPGLLQNLDLKPNTSIREDGYQPVGQTGYRGAIPNDAASLAAGLSTSLSRGLTAWFLSEVNDDFGAAATGTAALTTVVTGNVLTIGTTPNAIFTAGLTQVSGAQDFQNTVAAGSDILAAASLAAAINDDANWAAVGIARPVSAANGGTDTVTITALADGTAGNYALTVNAGTIFPVGMAGGVDADSLTGVQAAQNATDVLTLLGYDVVDPASIMRVAAINAALTIGTITDAQVSEIFDILAGRNFVLLAGASVAPGGVWAPGGGAFNDTEIGFRRIYDTGSLRISFGEGRLSKIVQDDWSAAGAAVAVYNNDGTLYTV